LTNKMVPGGLIDGPIYRTIHDQLLGLHLSEPDEFARFQNEHVVYHDDIGDYSTNEPTMDGTAGSMIMMAHWSPDVE
jgi:endoglucanase